MADKALLLLAAVLVIGLANVVTGSRHRHPDHSPRNGGCSVATNERRACGVHGISPKECKRRCCCYDASIAGAIWCFHSKKQEKKCALAPAQRRECGFNGISGKECLARGCCFDSSIPEVIWCYFSK
ncbi:trefoil factor 2-like [Ambystoma mexicanum]|uniref:trefoil factor 2-like n=1 Tax=Ambystoma mexicanum TaxID=8296 RepID=UPI0037E7FF5B